MKKSAIAAFLLVMLSGCMSDSQAGTLFEYEGTLIGNNSDVLAIVNGIENGSSVEEIELHTKEKPYGLTIHYADVPDGKVERWTRENAGRLFTLIDNVEDVDMVIASETYAYSRKEMEKELGKSFDEVTTVDQWKEVQEWIN
ncbi:DUF4825 domain-containing protein [Salimicrobium halophilum]|uniref:DUF4825 domain-containing protein n=1 Tax=Salimicrobium halophilum TaxID=86666 RepID=A0A1G8R7F9_9BACI|nr:DUF4825 domain-containing protein [Salimicrobium halophilum]SDJ12505.1 protein of unknown function [Salimicrobium halophilum]